VISERHSNRFGSYLGAFALGTAAGVTIALLTAPRSGRETRRRLKNADFDLEKTVENIPGAIQSAVVTAVKTGHAASEQVQDAASSCCLPPTDGFLRR